MFRHLCAVALGLSSFAFQIATATAAPEGPARVTLTAQMVSREAFEQVKQMFAGPRLAPSEGDPRTVLETGPVPRGITPAELGAVMKRLEHAFFVSLSGHSATIEGDVAFLPGIEALDVKWTRVLDGTGHDVLRAPNAEEKEHDRTFGAFPLHSTDHGPEYKKELPLKPGVQSLTRAMGDATVVLPSAMVAFEMSCDKLGVPVRHAGQQMTLRSCENDLAQVDWTLPETGPMPKVVSVLRDAQGQRLHVSESGSEGLLADGRTLAQIEYTALPVTITSQRMSYLANGKVAKVTVLLPGRAIKKAFHVVATVEPRFEQGKPVHLEASRYAEPSTPGFGLAQARLDEVKAQTHVTAARTYAVVDYNQPELLVELPRHDNSAYATLEFSPAQLTDQAGAAVPHKQETTWVSYPDLRQALYLEPLNGKAKTKVEFAKARGVVKIHYPLAIEDVVLTKAKPSASGIDVRIDGPRVFITRARDDDHKLVVPSFAPTDLETIQAFDASGNRLRRLGYQGWRDGTEEQRYWGNVAQVKVRHCSTWADFEVPYDLAPAPLLPKGREGRAP
ncbi:MAG: hypothetical protein ABI321_14870 [Polyangia bacterium]